MSRLGAEIKNLFSDMLSLRVLLDIQVKMDGWASPEFKRKESDSVSALTTGCD